MRYKFYTHLTDLKDLNHIEWFILHSNEYEFRTEKSKELLVRLEKNISRKNTMYSDIVRDYEELVKHFDNDPYHYWFGLTGEDPNKWVESSKPDHYFVEATDREGDNYIVPYGYVDENRSNYEMTVMSYRYSTLLQDSKEKALSGFQAIQNHYYKYWISGGTKDAIERYKDIHYGKDYHIIRTAILFVLYNILLFKVIEDADFIYAVSHIWELIPDGSGNFNSAAGLYGGHRIAGLIILAFIAYFIYLDFIYAYGLYYIIYMNKKYKMVMTYHEGVLRYLEPFHKDFEACKKGISDSIVKVRNLESTYIPLIQKVSRKYDFYKHTPAAEGKNAKDNMQLLQSVVVPKRTYYKQPVHVRIIWLLIIFIVIRAF